MLTVRSDCSAGAHVPPASIACGDSGASEDAIRVAAPPPLLALAREGGFSAIGSNDVLSTTRYAVDLRIVQTGRMSSRVSA
jgi:hypothetical protein